MIGPREDDQPRLVQRLKALVGGSHADAVVACVTKRPCNDAGMVLILPIQVLHTLLEEGDIVLVGGHRKALIGEGHQVGIAHHIEPVAVAELVKPRVHRREACRAHSIDIHALHLYDITPHLFARSIAFGMLDAISDTSKGNKVSIDL